MLNRSRFRKKSSQEYIPIFENLNMITFEDDFSKQDCSIFQNKCLRSSVVKKIPVSEIHKKKINFDNEALEPVVFKRKTYFKTLPIICFSISDKVCE